MKPYQEIDLGFGDAENYNRSENKDQFNQLFVRNTYLDKLMQYSTYFLVGDKGTGKTAYAVYLANNDYGNTISDLKYIRETDYDKFISLKNSNNLALSDYVSVWKVIILTLISSSIRDSEIDNSFFSRRAKLNKVRDALNKYYNNAFAPEIMNTFTLIEHSENASKVFGKIAELTTKDQQTQSVSNSGFQTNLYFIQKQFEDALRELRMKKNHVLLIDGIDIRPGSIMYKDYLTCIKGLANAIWSLNNDFFPKIRDTQGRIRIVLLIRPDILNSLDLQNLTSKITDNSVFLEWRTTYPAYRESLLFELADRLLAYPQDEKPEKGAAWDYYNPWSTYSTSSDRNQDDSFINILKISYSRPRDIVSCLKMLQELKRQKNDNSVVSLQDFQNELFLKNYSEYLMGGIKDQLAFYYSSEDYTVFLHFFKCLNGKSEFSYNEYVTAYNEFTEYFLNHHNVIPEFTEESDKFLQFLYDTNVLCYIDHSEMGEPFFSWCYRDRSLSNFSPKVKINVRYRIHYGLHKSLKVGTTLVKKGKV